MHFILRMLISAGAIFGVAYLTGGSLLGPMDFWPTALFAAIILGIANAVIRPVLHVLTFPITLLTLGFFALVINAAMIYLVEAIVPGFNTVGFWQTIVASIIISIVSSIGSSLVGAD
jgi:putative membrane protein